VTSQLHDRCFDSAGNIWHSHLAVFSLSPCLRQTDDMAAIWMESGFKKRVLVVLFSWNWISISSTTTPVWPAWNFRYVLAVVFVWNVRTRHAHVTRHPLNAVRCLTTASHSKDSLVLNSNACGLYLSEGALIESRQGHLLSWQKTFVIFVSPQWQVLRSQLSLLCRIFIETLTLTAHGRF
jgi:hypothetical protein